MLLRRTLALLTTRRQFLQRRRLVGLDALLRAARSVPSQRSPKRKRLQQLLRKAERLLLWPGLLDLRRV
eukprot:1327183-Prymnesium_polylepis.1